MNDNILYTLPPMESVKDAAAKSGLPVHLIRTLIKDGKIKAIQSGAKKIYVNMNSLAAYLNDGDFAEVTNA